RDASAQVALEHRQLQQQRPQRCDLGGTVGARLERREAPAGCAPEAHEDPRFTLLQSAPPGVQPEIRNTPGRLQRIRAETDADANAVTVGLQLRAGIALEGDPLAAAQAEPAFTRFDPGTATQLHPDREHLGRQLRAAKPGDAYTACRDVAHRARAIRGVELQELAAIGPE